MSDSFISPEEAAEALERNRRLALEGTMEMKAPDEVGIDLESIKPIEVGKDISTIKLEMPSERDLWDHIFMLTDEIKRLRGELNAR